MLMDALEDGHMVLFEAFFAERAGLGTDQAQN